ncbi:MAG TPA: hypothetical protein VK846_16165 [Candidatus Limnocylindria bacterium]|nr:hypothetical protein [Candidatus Limnocylindria bacterium]
MDVVLEWDANPESSIAGYRVYIGLQSRQYDTNHEVGLATQMPLPPLEPCRTYYFAVTAYDGDGIESEFSEEVTYTTSEPITATPLTDVSVDAGQPASFATVAAGTGPFVFAWRKDGVALEGATNAIFAILETTIADAGTYSVEVSGACNTITNAAWLAVRMNETNAVPVPLRMTMVGAATPVTLTFLGETGRQYLVQASTDLRSWQTIYSVTSLADGTNQWTDSDATNHPVRFYRVLGSQP